MLSIANSDVVHSQRFDGFATKRMTSIKYRSTLPKAAKVEGLIDAMSTLKNDRINNGLIS
jgi:hypothetical protein